MFVHMYFVHFWEVGGYFILFHVWCIGLSSHFFLTIIHCKHIKHNWFLKVLSVCAEYLLIFKISFRGIPCCVKFLGLFKT